MSIEGREEKNRRDRGNGRGVLGGFCRGVVEV
jgi:hypothetical protein